MDLSSIFAYILKIAILLMNPHIEIPDEIDEKLKKFGLLQDRHPQILPYPFLNYSGMK